MPWIYAVKDLKGEETVGMFYENELQKANQKYFRTEKVIKRKGNKLYVKWKCYKSSFNSWIDNEQIFCKIKFFRSKCRILFILI